MGFENFINRQPTSQIEEKIVQTKWKHKFIKEFSRITIQLARIFKSKIDI